MYLKRFYLILILLSSQLFAGISVGTLVKTPGGYIKVENLKINDTVASFDIETEELAYQKITAINSYEEEKSICIVIENKRIITSLNQKFYLPATKSWEYAKNLTIGTLLLGKENIQITDIFIYNNKIELFNIEVENNHNFLVTKYDVLIHNNPLAIFTAIPKLIESAPVIVKAAVTMGTAIAVWFGLTTPSKKDNNCNRVKYKGSYYLKVKISHGNKYIDDKLTPNKLNHIFIKNGIKHGFVGGPNDQDPENWWKKIIERIEKALKSGEIVENGRDWEICEPQNINPNFGDLTIRGKIVAGIVEIGTAFLFDFKR